jgi:hypothetical protein
LYEWSKIRAPSYIIDGVEKINPNQKVFISTATVEDKDILKAYQYKINNKKSFCREIKRGRKSRKMPKNCLSKPDEQASSASESTQPETPVKNAHKKKPRVEE